MCLSAGRPTIIPQGARFDDLIQDYSDELYVMPTNEPTFETLVETMEKVISDIDKRIEKKPQRLLEDFSWEKSAASYVKLYKEVLS